MNKLGILGCVGNDRIDPKGTATKEQAIAFLIRVYDKFLDEPQVFIKKSPDSIPEGGGQSVTLVATIVDSDNSPLQEASVYINSEVHQTGQDRNAQLSASNLKTDDKGQVLVTYTTIAQDDNKPISIFFDVDTGKGMIHKSISIEASN